MSEEFELPQTVNFSDGDIEAQNKRDQLKEGYVFQELTRSQLMVSRNSGNLMFKQTWSPVTDDGTVIKKLQSTNFLVLPFSAGNGHTAPNTLGICRSYLVATGRLPRIPRWDGEAKHWVKEDGGTIDGGPDGKAEKDAIAKNLDNKAFGILQGWYNDAMESGKNGEEQVGDQLLTLVKASPDGQYRNIKKFVTEAGDEGDVVTGDTAKDFTA